MLGESWRLDAFGMQKGGNGVSLLLLMVTASNDMITTTLLGLLS